ncbi:MAG: type VI secretion system tip protein VgrG, partial [Deltaproteobacteria bacterium]|nr:type VI secretion system tip protein VgrG [Deltaproteobacteria bacterium]
KSEVTAIPQMTRFIPALDHPRPVINGAQTAIVTGPEGEEIYADQYGRVKVQFFWDRADQWNENASCWIRVSQGWAGSLYGAMAIPRIGHEVLVDFLEGNPDRPIITGRVYHELNRPPYALPEHKTRSVFKSISTPGEEGAGRGYNELRIEDKRNQEEVYGQAEKDVNIHVKNDWKERILHDKHRTTDHCAYTGTKKETHEKLHGARKTELFANDNLTVHGDKHFTNDGKHLILVGDEFHYEAGVKVVIEAGAELTLKAGGSYITFSNEGVYANGAMIRLNSGGSPGTGTPAEPLLPREAANPEVPPAPSALCLRRVGASRGAICYVEE